MNPWVEEAVVNVDRVRRIRGDGQERVGFTARSGNSQAHVAQLAEHILGKDEVNSSILFMGSTLRKRKFA
jgi:hypothetical protein